MIKEEQQIDTIISISSQKDLKLIDCQASYDIRDTNHWHLDSLGQQLVKTLKAAKLAVPFHLALVDEKNQLLESFSYKNVKRHLFPIRKKLDLGFLERHQLKITFTYPFYLFWEVASDRIITTFGLFFLLICFSYILFLQLKMERKLYEFRKKYTHTLVHNLRSPLVSTKQHLNALKYLPLSPEKREAYLDHSLTYTENVLLDIEKLLMVSVNPCGLAIKMEAFKPTLVIKQLCEKYNDYDPDKKISITFDCPEGLTVYADYSHIVGALSNLVENSIHYSGPEVHIHLTCNKVKRKVVFTIEDDGFGIPLHEQPYIFDENYRGDLHKQKHSHKGFGLGLFYVQTVVKAHQGNITVSSDGLQGTKFVLEIVTKSILHTPKNQTHSANT